MLYRDLLRVIVNGEFPRRSTATATRMIDFTPNGVFHGETIDPEVRAVTVNIGYRAGTLPSQITYDFLNTLLDPRAWCGRTTSSWRGCSTTPRRWWARTSRAARSAATSTTRILLFPDPMGADRRLDVHGHRRSYKEARWWRRQAAQDHRRQPDRHRAGVSEAGCPPEHFPGGGDHMPLRLRTAQASLPEDIFDTVPGNPLGTRARASA